MKAILQRQWRCCISPHCQGPSFSKQYFRTPQSFHRTSPVENQVTSVEWSVPILEQKNSVFARLHANLCQGSCLETSVASERGMCTRQDTSLCLRESGQICARRLEVSHENSKQCPGSLQDCFVFCRNVLPRRALHTTTATFTEMTELQAGNVGAGNIAENQSILKDMEEAMEKKLEEYEDMKKYVEEELGNKPAYLNILEQHNPLAEMKEPSIVDLRPPDRPLPPQNRVFFGLDLEKQYRVTRKTKWIIKQLRSPIMNDVPALLEQWVKTMYPKRSDWLDLLKEFSNDEKEQPLMFQIVEFALLEDTFEVRSRDLTRILIKYMNLERYDDVDRLMGTLDSKGFPPEFVVCTLLLDMNCKLKRLDKAREMFERIRSINCVPDVAACTKLIELYCETGNPKAGEQILAEMEQEKLHGSVNTYLAVMRGYGQQGKAKEAVRIFSIMNEDIFLKPGIGGDVYSALMEVYVHSNMLPSAVLGMETMLKLRLTPADNSVSLLLAAYEKKNQLERALEVLLKLESMAVRPGTKTLTTLIGWFGKMGLIEEAEILFKNIESKVDIPDCHAYASLYSVYARAGLVDKAKAILDRIDEGVLIEASAYEQMILSLLDSKQHEEAASMRDRMTAQGLTPSYAIEGALSGHQGLWGATIASEGTSESLGSETESLLSSLSKQAEESSETHEEQSLF